MTFREERQKFLELILIVILVGFLTNVLASAVFDAAADWPWYLIILAFLMPALGLAFIAYVVVFAVPRSIVGRPQMAAVANHRSGWIQPMLNPTSLAFSAWPLFGRAYEDAQTHPVLRRAVVADSDDSARLDFLEFVVLAALGDIYRTHWAIGQPREIKSFRRWEVFTPQKVGISKFRKDDLPADTIGRNMLLTALPADWVITLPPQTALSLRREDQKNRWIAEMKNPYCSVTLRGRWLSGMTGYLGQGRPHPLLLSLGYAASEAEELALIYYEVRFEAVFHRWHRLFPRADWYLQWADNMLYLLTESLDFPTMMRQEPKGLLPSGRAR